MLLATLMVETACSGSSGIGASESDAATLVPDAASLNINIIVGNQTITATMEDNGINLLQGTESMNVRFERQ